MSLLNVAMAQLNSVWEDKQHNYSNVATFAKLAKEKDAGLLILPEMFSTGFSMNKVIVEESDNGSTIQTLKEIAALNHMPILGSYIKNQNGNSYNMAVLLDEQGEVVFEYAKSHLFTFGGEAVFSQGSGPVIGKLGEISFTCFICYDLRFPELFRVVSEDVELIIVIANWPSSRADHWHSLLKARAIENQAYVIGVNRVGEGGGIHYVGGSTIIHPSGKIISLLDDEERLWIEQLNMNDVRDVRTTFPFLKDKRFI